MITLERDLKDHALTNIVLRQVIPELPAASVDQLTRDVVLMSRLGRGFPNNQLIHQFSKRPFAPFTLTNVTQSGTLTPAGLSGCWVTMIGGGSSGSNTTDTGGFAGQTAGGGGGSRVSRIFIPATLFGSTFSITRGLGGARGTGVGGTASIFTTGTVTLTAGGGTVGVGGVASGSGITTTGFLFNGKANAVSDAVNDVGAGGGNGGASSGGAQAGTAGGSSLTVVAGTGQPADAAIPHGGAGGHGGASYVGAGSDGGLYGGGGGGAGQGLFSGGGLGGKGGDGLTLLEFV